VLSGDELRAAMRRFPTGIAVATTTVDGRRFGITIGSLVSLSLDPPLVGISIGHDTQAHELLRESRGFAISVLAGDQTWLAQHFARSVPPIAQWEGIASRDGARGPLLDGSLAWIECAVDGEHLAGDHTIFVARVEHVELGRTGPGLVYREGGYHPA
jgi:3-hydroxy-9,10-secoandrosta-1,3,5(10)-triene-9,17-dione monooxygenase reductase component